jgi:hypothetical protein
MATEIGRSSLLARVALSVARFFTKNTAQGAATSVMCAARPELAAHGGRYFQDCAPHRSSRESRDPEVARRLWALSEGWIGA